MKRRTLDIVISIGGAALAGLLVVVALVLTSNANFSKDYVAGQLNEQGITFKAEDQLTPWERQFTEARSGCVITYAGQPVTTGKQAECFANEYIGAHLKDPAANPPAEGRSFSELGTVRRALLTQIAEAEATNDPGLTALQDELAALTAARNTVFQGEMLRGTLLTAYGFSVLGDKAEQGARVAYLAAIVLAVLAAAGFVHAFATPKTRLVGHAEPVRHAEDKRLEHI